MIVRDPDALVLGGTVDGLVAAAVLARAGRTVLLLEPSERCGGRARTEEFHPGFRASATLHASGGLHPRVVEELELQRHGYAALWPLERGVTTLRTDGPPLRLTAEGPEGPLSEDDAEGYLGLRAFLDRVVPALRPLLVQEPLPFRRPSWRELLASAGHALRLRALGREDLLELLRVAPACLADFTEDWLRDDALRATVAFPGLLCLSAGPRSPGTTLALLLHEALSFEGGLGRGSLPKGGLGTIGGALEDAARRAGVVFLCGERPRELVVEGGVARGVRLEDGRVLGAGVVLSSLGPRTTLLELLPPGLLGPSVRRGLLAYRDRGATAVLRYALGELPTAPVDAEALAGHVQIGADLDELERAFDDAKYGRWSQAPVVDLCFPSLTDPSLAPAGRHVATALAQFAPYTLREGSWEHEREAFADAVTARIDAHLPGFAAAVLAREVLVPPDLEERYGLEGGHLHGGDLALDQLFTNRPLPAAGTYATPVERLYLTGGATHPGGPPSGAAGYAAARRILREGKARAAR